MGLAGIFIEKGQLKHLRRPHRSCENALNHPGTNVVKPGLEDAYATLFQFEKLRP